MIGQIRIIRFGSMLKNEMPLSLFSVGYNEQKHIVRPEGFPVVQFLLVRSGSGTFDFYGADLLSLGPDEFIILPPSIPHEYYPNPSSVPWELGYVSLTGRNVESLLHHLEFDSMKVMKMERSEKVWQSLDQLWAMADKGIHDLEWEVAGKLYDFLLLLKRLSYRHSADIVEINEGTRSSLAVKQAAEIIRKHYSEPLLLSHLAQSLGYTHQHLNLLFHQKYKTSVYHYLQRVRFEASLPLLRDHSLPVHEVARRVGLEIGSYIRLFRQMHGTTPGSWRKKNE
ncbi:MAG: hypothetical protein K0Q73_3806 [Paenibacillus sp.]|jgi:AraC-like DNA-binding protein|nr:hypothetical protein [Paenibacillus sp.]